MKTGTNHRATEGTEGRNTEEDNQESWKTGGRPTADCFQACSSLCVSSLGALCGSVVRFQFFINCNRTRFSAIFAVRLWISVRVPIQLNGSTRVPPVQATATNTLPTSSPVGPA